MGQKIDDTEVAAKLLSEGGVSLKEAAKKFGADVYEVGGHCYTIDELRSGYRELTGLDNDTEMSDDEVYQYMVNAMGGGE